ncbi:uncharacterized protein LACBIDRAFT_294591 [Laccaria bicolor S238N-H82]|uniref:Predicted protein n=1 Tax=Laccaria bicolor (strain S238N-H82 / ATCC MYA-4686) TaxID=486041 RepID=B0DEY2_LACBS|nr:uncharacterized protein LACBIDRAFT_294591 [Laccaria bicolor S238N-H82]EDR06627.1 predicted protein [Laccaria bicolor S238N-H82]|eukprot:XP_001882474.1 predicted protein [Laccaria bicolor S238N-H82]
MATPYVALPSEPASQRRENERAYYVGSSCWGKISVYMGLHRLHLLVNAFSSGVSLQFVPGASSAGPVTTPEPLPKSQQYPQRELHEETREHDTTLGVVYPDDRHFIISPNITTIVQFRTLDYGMERCTLHASLPDKTDALDPAATIVHPSTLDIWRLNIDYEITRHRPESWKFAPLRKSLFGTFEFPQGEDWASDDFHCRSLSYTTLEFTCSTKTPDCHVDFWQDRASANAHNTLWKYAKSQVAG